MGNRYESVSLADLKQGRLGKHHKLMENILAELRGLAEGRAMKIPLDTVKVTKANLRAAIVRAAKTRGIAIATYSDDENFYVWLRTRKTAEYERKRRNGR